MHMEKVGENVSSYDSYSRFKSNLFIFRNYKDRKTLKFF